VQALERYYKAKYERFKSLLKWRDQLPELLEAARSVLPDAEVYVFGSALRNELTANSDVDILIVSDEATGSQRHKLASHRGEAKKPIHIRNTFDNEGEASLVQETCERTSSRRAAHSRDHRERCEDWAKHIDERAYLRRHAESSIHQQGRKSLKVVFRRWLPA